MSNPAIDILTRGKYAKELELKQKEEELLTLLRKSRELEYEIKKDKQQVKLIKESIIKLQSN